MEYEGDRASWMPDEVSSECLLCRSRFTLTRRRHHCRACKRLVCGSCSSNELSMPMPLPSTDSASVGFLVGGLANIHGPAVTTMAMQRVCDECYSRMTGLPPPVREKRVMLLNGRGGRAAEGADGQQLLLHTGERSKPLVLKVWVGRACGVGGHGGEDGHGVHHHHHHSNPPVATGRTSWYCVVRLNREVVGQTSVQAYRGRWTAWEETLSASLRLPSTLGGPAACSSQQQLTLDVLEKGRKMNGDVLLGQARVPLAYALSGPASPTGTAPDLCTRLIDPNSSRDAGRLVLRVWVSDATGRADGEVGQSAAMALALLPPSPPALIALFPPGSPLFPFLFYRTPSGRVVPQHETVVDVFEDAQLSIKNSRVQRTRQGRLIVTTHRLLHLCHASPSEGRAGLPSDMPSQLPLACLSSITVKGGGKATRGAPPVLEVTCKNQLTYLYQVQAPCDPLASPTSRASSSSSQPPLPSSLSDYSHLSPQPSPPLLPPAFEAEQLVARLRAVQEEVLWRQIEDDYAFPAGRSRFFPLATSPSPACSPARTTQPPTDRQQEAGVVGELDWMSEFSRQGVTDNPLWRISHVNKGSKLCPTYPEVLLVPVSVSDADLIKAAEFRSRARIPVITWICPVTGAALTRSSQPLTGLTSSANPADDKLLLAIRATAYVGHAMGDKYACVDLMEGSTIDDDSAWTEVITTTAKDEEGGGGAAPAAQAEQGLEEQGEGSGPPGERQQEEEETTSGHDDVEGEEEGEEEPLLPTEEEMEALAASLEGQFFYDAEDHNASTGLLGSPFDEVVLSPHHGAPPPHPSRPDPVLRILDARPMVNAMGNQLLGKGSEVISRLGGEASTTLEYLNVANIHVMRESYLTLLAACHEHSDDAFLSNLHESRWLHHVSQILKGALTVSRYLEGGDPVLVHCSDGWDRTSQLTFLSQLLMDPYYRTRAGFRVLVEKEWCQFSHQFRQRSGGDSEFSPIFIQAMDATWQLLRQFPTAFEFNERLLLLLVEAVYSRWFKNFMYDSEAERQAALHDDFTRHHHQHHHGGGAMASSSSAAYSVWDVVEGDPDAYRNVLYDCNAERRRSARGALQHLRPRPEVSRLALWRELYLRDHMRFAAERGPSRLSREQALEKRVLALEQQLGLGLAPLDARAAQEKIRDIAELAALLGKKAALVDDMITASVGGAATNGHSHAAPRHVARASSCVDVHVPPPHPAPVRKTRSLSPPTAAVPSSPPPPQAVVVKAAAAADVSASGGGRRGHHQRKERSAPS